MNSFKDLIKENNVDNLHVVVEALSERYLCFTRYDTSDDLWVICTSDGCDIWMLQIDEEEFSTRKELAKVESSDAYLGKFRLAFKNGEVSINLTGSKLGLNVGEGVNTLDFDLFEAKAVQKKREMQLILFRLAEYATELQSKLATANQTIEKLKGSKANIGSGALFDPDLKQQKGQSKAQAKQVGMSVINPGSKKRKAAKGIVFD